MMKKKIPLITMIAMFAVILIPISCSKDFLNQTNSLQSTAENTFDKPSDVISLVNSIYDTYQNSDLMKKQLWYWANFESHDFFNWGGDYLWNNYTFTATYSHLIDLWNNAYIGIARANTSFEIISAAQKKGVLTQELADRLTGEVYFLRGMTYYYLAACFGGVPLELLPKTDGLTPRSPRDSVFMQIVSDMDNASKLLPWKEDYATADLGRATRGSAIGYEGMARMWLKDYAGAITNFNALDGKYHLIPKFVDVHEYNNQNNDESLFEIQFDLPPGGSQSWDGSWNPPGGELAWIDAFSWPAEITDEGYDYGNPALWLSYQTGDQRKRLTILGPGDSIQSPGIIAAWGGIKGYPYVQAGFQSNDPRYIGSNGKIINTNGTVARPWYGRNEDNRTGYVCAKKWRDPSLTGSSGNPKNANGAANIFGSQNQILLRYAEILLSRAECKVHTGDIAGAMDDIKQVRDRAWGGVGLAPALMQDSANFDGTPGLPITDPLQMVLSEYRHELSGEYSVYFDLCRAGTDVAIDFIKRANGTVDGSLNPVANPAPGPSNDGKVHGLYNTTPTAKNTLLPIPQVAIGLNPNLTQNPGY